MNDFRLLGHDCPYGRYPAPVIPVGELTSGKLVAIYPGGKAGATGEQLEEGSKYVEHTSALQTELRDFDWKIDRLFAFAPQQVERYATDEEAGYLQNILGRPELCDTDAFLRLMMAKQTGRRSTILREIDSCYAQLKAHAPKSADEWREVELVRLPREVFITYSFEMRNSPIVSFLRTVIANMDGTSATKMEWKADGTRNLAEVENRIREAAVFVEVIGSDQGGESAAPAVTYERGLAVGLKKPALLVNCSSETAYFDRERDTLIYYNPRAIQDEAAREGLASQLSAAIKGLKERASQIAKPPNEPVMNVFELARDVRREGRVLARLLGKVLQNASDPFAVSQSAEFEENWGQYKRIHVNRMAHHLNGRASQAQNVLTTFLENAPEALQQLGIDFGYLRSAMLSYEDAFRTAKESVGAPAKTAAGLLSVIGPLDQTLHNVNDGADQVITELITIMLPLCTAQPPTNEFRYRVAKV